MKLEMHADAMLLKGRGITLSIVEYQGRTEVVVQGKEENVRVLNDKDGLHVGTIQKNRKSAKPVPKKKATKKTTRKTTKAK